MNEPGPDPSEEEARQLLQDELAKPDYNQPESWIERLVDWVFEQLSELLLVLPGSSSLSTLLILGVVAIVVISAVFVLRHRLRESTMSLKNAGSVLDEVNLSAGDYRQRAVQAARGGDWDTVLLDSYRALTASAGERTLLDEAPSRTAHEVSMQLGPAFPTHAEALRTAADDFDRVRYGEQHCTRERAEAVRDLDAAVLATRPESTWAAGPADRTPV